MKATDETATTRANASGWPGQSSPMGRRDRVHELLISFPPFRVATTLRLALRGETRHWHRMASEKGTVTKCVLHCTSGVQIM